MEAKVKIVVTNVKEFHELWQELREKEKAYKEALNKLAMFDLKIDTEKE
ncbi:MAG: hypothetical protein HXL41_06720 [Solobacterium sp.]|nr:hypothetical protein [Solobacterium sp.]